MDWTSFLYGYAVATVVVTTTETLFKHYKYKHNNCKYCKQRYVVKNSTSEFCWVFCSTHCEYFEVLDYLSTRMSLEQARKVLLTSPKYKEIAIFLIDDNAN